jgi:nucleotide-binding universal stress UspA family protein
MFLAERYWPGISPSRLADAEERMATAVRDLARSGVEIRILSSTFIPAEEVVLTLFEATHVDDVVEANRRSGVPFDRVQAVEVSLLDAKGGRP